MTKARTHTETRTLATCKPAGETGAFYLYGGRGPTGGRLGANTTPRTQNAKRLRRSLYRRERRRSDTKARAKIPTLQNQTARAIPPREVQPIPANDSTRTEPAGAVQPWSDAQERPREIANNIKKEFVCNTLRSRVKIWPDNGNARQAGHKAAKYTGAILRGGRRKRPDRTVGTRKGAALSLEHGTRTERGQIFGPIDAKKRPRCVTRIQKTRRLFQIVI